MAFDWRNISLVLDESDRLEDAGQYEQAFSFLSKAIRSVPDNPRYRLYRGKILCFHLRRFKKGLADLECAAVFEPDSPLCRKTLNLCLLMAGQVESAREHALRAIKLDSADSFSYSMLAQCELALRQPENAIKQLEIALKIDPESEQCWNLLGSANLAAGRLENAEASYLKAIAIEPLPGTYISLARVQLDLKNKQGAISSLERATKFELDEVNRILIDGFMARAKKVDD